VAEQNGSITQLPTLAVAWVWNDEEYADETGCSSTQWTLFYGATGEDSESPIPPVSEMSPVLNGSAEGHEGYCANPGTSQYTEAHWSTSTDTLAVVISPFNGLEGDQTTVAEDADPFYCGDRHVDGIRDDSGVHFGNACDITFLDAGIGVDASNGTDAGNLPSGTVFGYNRNGLTEPAGFNHGGIAGSRITFDLFPTVDFLATTDGGAPSVTNPATLTPSALPAVSSDFTVTAP
jgi:hypothetical protein